MRIPKARPLYVHIASLFLALFSLLGVVQVVLSYWQGYESHYRFQKSLFHRQSSEVEQAIQLQLLPAQVALEQLLFDPLIQTKTLESRQKVFPRWAQILRRHPTVSALYAGYANGDFILLRPLPQGLETFQEIDVPVSSRFLGQSIEWIRGAPQGTYLFLDSTLKVVRRLSRPQYRFDPRERPWFQQALLQEGISFSKPYLFFTTREPGTTLAIASKNQKIVLGADLSVAGLSDFLAQMPLPDSSLLVLYDTLGNIVAASRDRSNLFQNATQLPQTADLNIPIPPTQESSHWVSYTNTLKMGAQYDLFLTVALPNHHFQKIARQQAKQAIIPTVILLFLLIPLVWLVARRTAKPLLILKDEANSIRHFNFATFPRTRSRILEIDELAEAMMRTKQTICEFMSIGKAMGAKGRFDPLLTTILKETIQAVGANGGILYLLKKSGETERMEPVRAFWDQIPVESLQGFSLQAPHALSRAAHGLRQVGDITEEEWNRDFPLWGNFGASVLVAEPMENQRKEAIGLLVIALPSLENTEMMSRIALLEALAGTSAMAIEAQQLIEEQKRLLESFIEIVASAIDAKSPYTGAHCQRVPILTQMIAEAACAENTGPLATFQMNPDQWEALHIASWLHDCGKVTTPEFVVDKATKLETLYDRIHEIRMRFEVMKREVWITELEKKCDPHLRVEIRKHVEHAWKILDSEFEFVAQCNEGSESLSEVAITRLQTIGQRTWTKTIDDQLGVSIEEKMRMKKRPQHNLPHPEPLLADREDHLIERSVMNHIEKDNPWGFKDREPHYLYNRGELYNLSIPKGTLTEEERYVINQHMSQTIVMLSKLPFPPHLHDVPDIAGGHHEKLDGSGYPRHLKKNQLLLQARIIAIADVFEALTASDRPYKKGKTVREALTLMSNMVAQGHLDGDLFDLFIRSRVWKDYALQYLSPEQCDSVMEKDVLPPKEDG